VQQRILKGMGIIRPKESWLRPNNIAIGKEFLTQSVELSISELLG